eukprot:373396_1
MLFFRRFCISYSMNRLHRLPQTLLPQNVYVNSLKSCSTTQMDTTSTNGYKKLHKMERYMEEIPISSLQKCDPIAECVQKLFEYVEQFNKAPKEEFWNRKSNQNVLAVVQCFIDGKYEYYYARNIEIHLGSGSICSERAAIISAVSNNPSIHRKDITLIAVIDPDGTYPGREPCGVCQEHIQKIQEESAQLRVITFPNPLNPKTIYVHYPANRCVEVTSEEAANIRRKLDDEWRCNCCGASVSGHLTNCWHCGYAENELQRSFSITFRNPQLTLNVVDVIYNNFYPDKEFTYVDVMNALVDDDSANYNQDSIMKIVGWISGAPRGILDKVKPKNNKRKTIWRTGASFCNYRNALIRNLKCIDSRIIIN